MIDFPDITLRTGDSSLQNCNGVITTSSRIYEPEGNLALEHHFSETNRPLYAIATLGLTAPVGVDQMLSPAERSAVAFLDRIMVEYGERSLLYVSQIQTITQILKLY